MLPVIIEVPSVVDYSFRFRRSQMALKEAATAITYGRPEKALENLRVVQLISEDQEVIQHAIFAIDQTNRMIHGEMI